MGVTTKDDELTIWILVKITRKKPASIHAKCLKVSS